MIEDGTGGLVNGDEGDEDPAYDADLIEHAAHNVQALIAATMAFLGDRQVSPGEWTAYLGERFARDWSSDDPLDAEAFLDGMLTNLQTLGALAIETDFTSRPVSATLSGFPDTEICDAYGVSPETVASYLDTAAAAAARHGLGWSWRLKDDLLVVSVATGAADSGEAR